MQVEKKLESSFENQNIDQFLQIVKRIIENPQTSFENSKYVNHSNKNFEKFVVMFLKWASDPNREADYLSFEQIFEQLIIIAKDEDQWFISITKFFTFMLKKVANSKQNKSAKQQDTYIENLNKAVNSIRTILCNFQSVKTNEFMKLGILFCINELCWIYFKLSNYHQCKSLIKTVQQNLDNKISIFKMDEQVTYLYYSGRMALFDSAMDKAYQDLSQAFILCKGYKGNNHMNIKKQILKYLIIVQIYNGKYPRAKLIKSYCLQEYWQLSQSVKKGDLMVFNREVEKYKRLWMKRGIYLNMEKLKTILIRNLFKQIFMLQFEKTQSGIMETQLFVNGLNWRSDEKYEIDEVECIIANMIMKQYIRGYISHEKRKIGFSKNNAFPIKS